MYCARSLTPCPHNTTAQLMRKLSHPNIVRYIGTERDAKELVIFLELVPGGSISSMLGKYGKFKESVVRGYCREILHGLEYLHANKILHRDIKGPNILVDFAGVCKLSDFGCSKELYGEIASTMTLKGTPQFMAPEVLRNHGKGYTEKADVWSVGCTVIEMCTARRPWPEFNTNEAVMYHVAMRDSCPKTPDWVSQDCKDFCAKCFARDAARRPKVSELLRHPLVNNASLDAQQRLGSTSADPAEISLEMEAHGVKLPKGAATPACPPAASAACTTVCDITKGGGGGGGGASGAAAVDDEDGARCEGRSGVPVGAGAAGRGGRSCEAGSMQTAVEPEPGLAQPGKRGGGRRTGGKAPMGGVMLRDDPGESEEEEEDSCSSDDGDDDGGRTPVHDALYKHIRRGSHSSSSKATAAAAGAPLFGPASHSRNPSTDHAHMGLSSEAAWAGGRASRRPLAESLVRDVESALQMADAAHVLVQSVTCNRQKCFSLAQVRDALHPKPETLDPEP
jgi:hypothetical protein